MSTSEEHARNLLHEADKKLSSKGFLQTIFGFYRNTTEDAITCYQKAGRLFQLSRNWSQAGSAYQTAANLNVQHRNQLEAAEDYVHAAKCLERYDIFSAINSLLSAVQIYSDLGRYLMPPTLLRSVAEIYEHYLEIDKADYYYGEAAGSFKLQDNYQAAIKCLLKRAHFAAYYFCDYQKSIGIYEEIGFYALRNPLLPFSAKECFFKAILCHLCENTANAKSAMETYAQKYPGFLITKVYKFLKKIFECLDVASKAIFQKVVNEQEKGLQLTGFHKNLLARIAEGISEETDSKTSIQ